MNHEDRMPPAVGRSGSLAYELATTLHALAQDLVAEPVDLARVESRLRLVIGLGHRALDKRIPLPRRPFDYSGDAIPLGPGALLLEYLSPGATGLGGLLAELDRDLVAELDQLVTRADALPVDQEEAPTWGRTVDAVPVLLAPVHDWHVIAGADIAFDPRPVTAGPGGDPGTVQVTWSPLPDTLAIEQGLLSARELVVSAGQIRPTDVRTRVDVRCVLNPSLVTVDSCAPAVALCWIAAEGGLPDPGELGVLTLANISEEGLWLPPSETERALAGAAETGFDVLWRDGDGWRMRRAGTVEADPDPTLLGAARLLWGEGWYEAVRRWARRTLDAHEWRILHSNGVVGADLDWSGAQDPHMVDFERSSFLFRQFYQRPLSRVIQSGARNSGKTVCAQQVVRKVEAAGWQTVVLSPGNRQAPPDGELLAVVRAALTATAVDKVRRKVLVVLEDLHALEDGNIGEALESLGELKVGVLALTRFVDGAANHWDNSGVTAYVTVVLPEQVPDLARAMLGRDPAAYVVQSEDTAAVELAAEACQGDLRVLADLLREGGTGRTVAAATAAKGGSSTELLLARAQGVWDALTTEVRSELSLLAAVSWLDAGVPSAYVAAVPEEARRALDVTLRQGDAWIPSTVQAEAVLACASFKETTARDALPDLVEAYAVALLMEDDHERVRSLLRNCAAYAPEQLAALLDGEPVRAAITNWSARAHPRTALSLLRLCQRHSESHWIAAALPPVLRRIPKTSDLAVRDLTVVLTALWDHEQRLSQDAVADLVAWAGEPDGGLDAVLARSSSLQDRQRMVSALLKLAGEGTTPTATVCEWLERRAEDLVRDADPRRHQDLIAIRRMDEIIFNRAVEARKDDPRTVLRPLLRPAQVLLNRRPTRSTPLAAILSWLSLRLHFDGSRDWDADIEQYRAQLQAALAYSDAIQISQALKDLARNNRGLSNRLLNQLKFGHTLVPVVRAATPAEASILISTVRNIHAGSLRTLLYQENHEGKLVADASLARELAKTADDLRDARGAGMLLKSVADVDDLYCDTEERFSYRLACELGRKFTEKAMERERRPAIVYYLLRGLWEAGADYREDMEQTALDLVVSNIQAQRGSARPWGPRLAMLLIQDDYFGQRFLRSLEQRLDRQLLRNRMLRVDLATESMVQTHRLGLAVFPDIGKDFARKLRPDRAVRREFLSTASHAAQKLQVLANTLRASGQPAPTALVLQHFKEQNPRWDWAERLRADRRVGAFTTALGQLRKMDPGSAATAVQSLSQPHAGQDLSHLRELVVRSVVRPSLTAELLSELERCLPGLGRKELEALRSSNRGRWRTLVEEFKFEQDPVTQGVVGRQLARLGVTNRTEESDWMRPLVTGRWESTMHLLASPRAVTEMLNLAHTWEPQWGEQLAASVSTARLLSRLRLNLRVDLQLTPRLLQALSLTGRRDAYDAVFDHLLTLPADTLVHALGPHQASLLLKVVGQAHGSVDSLAEALGRLVGQIAARPLAVDAEAHWKGIGWAAQAVTECARPALLPPAVPALEPNTAADPAAIAWAAVWLPRSEWSTAVVERAVHAYEVSGSTQQWHAQDTCMALIAAARAGLLPTDCPLADHWRTADEANPALLTLLCREADTSPAIANYLAAPEVSQRMREALTVPDLSLHLCHRELAAAVRRLCPEPPALASSSGDLGL
ncbi:hypothetical protein ABZX60_31485 [Streptomyces olivaceus]|uniref:hypothetical protein n=1 Tax=Streptomyces olivaceus TaxID=47716 RepID=UPI0033A9EB08